MTFGQGPTPLYYQLKTILKSKILSSKRMDNKRLPSEAEFCKDYKISRATVRQALSGIMKDGLISRDYYSRNGSLMFVTITNFRPDLYTYRIELMRD